MSVQNDCFIFPTAWKSNLCLNRLQHPAPQKESFARMDDRQKWEQLYHSVPLIEVPWHFQGLRQSPYMLEYLTTVLRLCPEGGRTCETGIGSGYNAIWLSLRGIQAEGIDYAPAIVERAKQVNNILHGTAQFRVEDIFQFYTPSAPHYNVIHHNIFAKMGGSLSY